MQTNANELNEFYNSMPAVNRQPWFPPGRLVEHIKSKIDLLTTFIIFIYKIKNSKALATKNRNVGYRRGHNLPEIYNVLKFHKISQAPSQV